MEREIIDYLIDPIAQTLTPVYKEEKENEEDTDNITMLDDASNGSDKDRT